MTGTTTGQTALPTATDSDDNENFLTVSLTAALQALANLFESATGHDHSGSGKGKPIAAAGIANGAVTPAAMAATAYSTFTPTLTQSGALTLSTATGRYLQLGKLVIVMVNIVVNSAGAAGNAFVLGGLPVAARNASDSPGLCGTYVRAGSTIYQVSGLFATATTVTLYGGNGTNSFGTNPSFAAAAGDQCVVTLTYESA